MIEREPAWAVFIDYANLSFHQKSAGILDVVTRALIQTPMRPGTSRGRCDVRVYGGWYEDMLITQLAQNLAASLQRDFPAIVRLKASGGATLPIVTNADLAMALLEEPGQHMFGTYRRKAKAANVRVQDPASLGCVNTGCPLPAMKRLLEHGNCTMPGCTIVSADLIYRHEQKLVDTMLTCDLISERVNRRETPRVGV